MQMTIEAADFSGCGSVGLMLPVLEDTTWSTCRQKGAERQRFVAF